MCFEDGVETFREPFRSLWSKLRSYFRPDWIEPTPLHRNSRSIVLVLKKNVMHQTEFCELIRTATEFTKKIQAEPVRVNSRNIRSSDVDAVFARLLCMIAACSYVAETGRLELKLASPAVIEKSGSGYHTTCFLCPRSCFGQKNPVGMIRAYQNARRHQRRKHYFAAFARGRPSSASYNVDGPRGLTMSVARLLYLVQLSLPSSPRSRKALPMESDTRQLLADEPPKP